LQYKHYMKNVIDSYLNPYMQQNDNKFLNNILGVKSPLDKKGGYTQTL